MKSLFKFIHSNSLSKLRIQNPFSPSAFKSLNQNSYPKSLFKSSFKLSIQNPYSKSALEIPIQRNPKSPFKLPIQTPHSKISIQTPHSKSLFKFPIRIPSSKFKLPIQKYVPRICNFRLFENPQRPITGCTSSPLFQTSAYSFPYHK